MSDRRLNILFIHQNFPGQYKHLAPALAAEGHQVVALGRKKGVSVPGVKVINYRYLSKASRSIHPLAAEHEVKVIRGEAVAAVCKELGEKGFTPDVIYAHPGWGEALFLRDVCPDAKIIVYCEYYYNLEGQDVNFDPEFPQLTFEEECKLRMKNTCNLHAFQIGDVFVSPTQWQRSTYPKEFQNKIEVIHDGIDFEALKPRPDAKIEISGKNLVLTKKDMVVAYVARNLEPTRGFHWFMRALPELQRQEPDAHIVIVGADGRGYGKGRQDGRGWREIMLEELDGQLNLEKIHFLGWVDYDTYLNVLNVSSVHVYLTNPFVLSWSALEAAFIVDCMLVSDTGPVREFFFEEDTFEFSDKDELAKMLIERLQNPTRVKLRIPFEEFGLPIVTTGFDRR